MELISLSFIIVLVIELSIFFHWNNYLYAYLKYFDPIMRNKCPGRVN
uniref:Uncharacterized protein n=1 Tax=Cryptosporidium parvum TaxID=5807 RepID=F0X535_CRYPV